MATAAGAATKANDAKIRIDYEQCKRCGICTDLCPKRVFAGQADGTPVIARGNECSECGLCILLCPDYALDWN